MVLNDFLDVCQAQAEALHVMKVAGMNAVELIEYLLQILFLDADAIVLNGDAELVALIPGPHVQQEVLLRTLIHHGNVKEIE